METWDAITARRNVRQFTDRRIPAADLDRILEAGRRSPSSQNWQPRDFVLITDREQLRELSGDMDLARRLLGLPADRNWVLLISLGYPAERALTPIRNPRRRPFDEVVHRGRW